MDLDIVEATTVMADLEKGGLVQIQPGDELEIKEWGGISWKRLQQINIKRLALLQDPKDSLWGWTRDMKLKVKVIYAVLKDRQELSLSLSWEDNPHYTNWLYDFFGNTGSSVSLAQFFLTFW